jgi:hypothetical protein
LSDHASDHSFVGDHSIDKWRREVHSTGRCLEFHSEKTGVEGVEENDVTVVRSLGNAELGFLADSCVVEKIVCGEEEKLKSQVTSLCSHLPVGNVK